MALLHRHEWHTLTGIYALGALEGIELERFENHLRRCQSCAAEVRGLEETASRMGTAAALAPPAAMRQRVLTAAARTRQLPPVTGKAGHPAGSRGWVPRLSLAVAAASVAAAAILGVTQAVTQHQLEVTRARDRAIAAVLAAPGARIATGTTTSGGTVTAVVSAQERRAVIITAGLPELPAAKVYELWLMSPAGARPAGLLPAARAGHTVPVLASTVSPGDKLGITIEPAGGTSHPTTAPILVMAMPA
ncbi:MAG TPA: anti-sigma factor [Streptosporangiaceae bacterium]|nr:anti-sigma factor [Streptosporangiaceae bacterium]